MESQLVGALSPVNHSGLFISGLIEKESYSKSVAGFELTSHQQRIIRVTGRTEGQAGGQAYR